MHVSHRAVKRPLDVPGQGPVSRGISPVLAGLIAEYRRCAETLARIDDLTDPEAWDVAGEIECRALKAVIDHRPANLDEYLAKRDVLLPATVDDSERYILRHLEADAADLGVAA